MAPIPLHRTEDFPPMRRILEVTLRSAARMPVVHGLVEFDVTEVRRRIRAHREATGESLSFTAFIVACVAAAVAEHPQMHACRLGGRRLRIYDDVDVALMVERDIEGRKQPIIAIARAANRLSVLDLHRFIRDAQQAPIEKTWEGLAAFRFVPVFAFRLFWPLLWWLIRRDPELQRRFRGTISVSAFGMFGHGGGWGIPITNTTAISVGGIAVRPGFVDGAVVPRDMLAVTLSVDHTIIDGAVAARFMERLRELVESGFGLPQEESPIPASANDAGPAVTTPSPPVP